MSQDFLYFLIKCAIHKKTEFSIIVPMLQDKRIKSILVESLEIGHLTRILYGCTFSTRTRMAPPG
jgi:hypothetical protein